MMIPGQRRKLDIGERFSPRTVRKLDKEWSPIWLTLFRELRHHYSTYIRATCTSPQGASQLNTFVVYVIVHLARPRTLRLVQILNRLGDCRSVVGKPRCADLTAVADLVYQRLDSRAYAR